MGQADSMLVDVDGLEVPLAPLIDGPPIGIDHHLDPIWRAI